VLGVLFTGNFETIHIQIQIQIQIQNTQAEKAREAKAKQTAKELAAAQRTLEKEAKAAAREAARLKTREAKARELEVHSAAIPHTHAIMLAAGWDSPTFLLILEVHFAYQWNHARNWLRFKYTSTHCASGSYHDRITSRRCVRARPRPVALVELAGWLTGTSAARAFVWSVLVVWCHTAPTTQEKRAQAAAEKSRLTEQKQVRW
jgi:hypothetical protein